MYFLLNLAMSKHMNLNNVVNANFFSTLVYL
jgi:hypothetical protein